MPDHPTAFMNQTMTPFTEGNSFDASQNFRNHVVLVEGRLAALEARRLLLRKLF